MKTRKMLVTILIVFMLISSLSITAYASDTNSNGNLTPQDIKTTTNDEDQMIDLDDIVDTYFIDFEVKEPQPSVVTVVKPKNTTTTTNRTSPQNVKKAPSYSEAELRLLACLIYAEAGNQSYRGKLAVANVVLNRVKSNVYSHVNTIEEVIYDRKWAVQFSVTVKDKKTGLSRLDRALRSYDTGKFSGNAEVEKKAMESCIKAAKAALEGENNIGDYLCFTGKRNSSSIKRRYPDYLIIGDHIFYRTK